MSRYRNRSNTIWPLAFVVGILAYSLGWSKAWTFLKELFQLFWIPLWDIVGKDFVLGYIIYGSILLGVTTIGMYLTYRKKRNIYAIITAIIDIIGLVALITSK